MTKSKILIVDDDAHMARMIKSRLQQTEFYEVGIETNATDAVNSIRVFMPEIILLDIMMPGVSGEMIADEILNDEELSHIKIIFLTGLITKHEVQSKGDNFSGRTLLAKPVDIDELLICIEEQLNSPE
jgi:CheY-like chemotaxis protein